MHKMNDPNRVHEEELSIDQCSNFFCIRLHIGYGKEVEHKRAEEKSYFCYYFEFFLSGFSCTIHKIK